MNRFQHTFLRRFVQFSLHFARRLYFHLKISRKSTLKISTVITRGQTIFCSDLISIHFTDYYVFKNQRKALNFNFTNLDIYVWACLSRFQSARACSFSQTWNKRNISAGFKSKILKGFRISFVFDSKIWETSEVLQKCVLNSF